MTLKLTRNQLNKFINGDLNEHFFEEIFDDIPLYHEDYVKSEGETHRDYMEEDGREYRWFIFKNKETNEEYCLNYTRNVDWDNDLMDVSDNIEVVSDEAESSVYVKPEPIIIPKKTLTPEEQADADLWTQYRAIENECISVKPKERIKVPKARIDEILNFTNSGEKYSIYQLRAVILPVCIEYKIEQASFWKWIQPKIKY